MTGRFDRAGSMIFDGPLFSSFPYRILRRCPAPREHRLTALAPSPPPSPPTGKKQASEPSHTLTRSNGGKGSCDLSLRGPDRDATDSVTPPRSRGCNKGRKNAFVDQIKARRVSFFFLFSCLFPGTEGLAIGILIYSVPLALHSRGEATGVSWTTGPLPPGTQAFAPFSTFPEILKIEIGSPHEKMANL